MIAIGRYFGILAVTLSLLAPATAHAQDKKLKAPVIAVLDMRVIMRESHAGKAWQVYYNKEVKAQKEEISSMEKELRPAWEELQRQKTILAPQAFQTREREFRQKEASANSRISSAEQQRGQNLQRTFHEVQQVIFNKLRPIRDKIVAEKGIDMVIFLNPDINYVAGRYDITKEVLTQLDRDLPKLDVPAIAKKVKK